MFIDHEQLDTHVYTHTRKHKTGRIPVNEVLVNLHTYISFNDCAV